MRKMLNRNERMVKKKKKTKFDTNQTSEKEDSLTGFTLRECAPGEPLRRLDNFKIYPPRAGIRNFI